MANAEKNFMVEDAQIIFRNFSGAEGQFNDAGDRNFTITLVPEVAEQMLKDGWNVKMLQPRDEESQPTPIITIKVSFKNYPPKITLITSVNRTILTEEEVAMLDWADILTCDLICRGYDWTVGDKSGTKAYLQTMFITINEDPLERKYARMGVTE